VSSTEEYYNEKSSDYERGLENLYFKVYDAITWKYTEPYVPADPQALVLDAGGGTGRWSVQMARKGCKVILLDTSEGMLAVAQTKVNQEKLQDRVTIKKGSILNPDFPSETFDMVFCEHVLFLFQDPSKVVKALARVLKRNSLIVISAQNKYAMALAYLPDDPKEALELLSGKHLYKLGNLQVNTLTPKEFRDILEMNGLKVEKMIGKGVTMPLRIPPDIYYKKEYTTEFFKTILQIELALCESEMLAGAGHLQATARKL
jgi:ubiquinone/menaquinone biosynthesis C-methylase UbiE